MKVEINFYQCDDTISKSISPLLLKVLDENKKALILVNDAVQIKEIDSNLWNYGKSKFIPHAVYSDKDFNLERQPIVISDKEENFNKADYLVLTKEVSENFLKSFSRVFYFYDPLNVDAANKLLKKYKSISGNLKSYKKESGKWIKADL